MNSERVRDLFVIRSCQRLLPIRRVIRNIDNSILSAGEDQLLDSGEGKSRCSLELTPIPAALSDSDNVINNDSRRGAR